MKKAIISLILVCVLLFTACGEDVQYSKEKIKVELFPYDMPETQTKIVTLYYPNEDLTDILAFSQPIVATDALYEEIMRALLFGTDEGYVSPFSEGVTCRNIMLLQNILYIDMSWQFSQMPKEKLFACISVLVNTYTAFSEVAFVNLTVEGKQITLSEKPDRPIMLLSRYTGSIQSLGNYFSSEPSNIETFYGAIYVADETNKYIIPQVSSITVREKGYATALISHLIAESTSIFPAGFMLSGEPKYDGKTEKLTIELISPIQWNYSEGWLGASAIISTLDSLYSEISVLKLTVKDNDGNEKINIEEKVSDYFSKIKSSVQVFLPDIEGTGIIKANLLVSSMPGSGGLKGFLKEYLYAVNPEFSKNENIIKDVAINDNTVIINLSADYFEYYERAISSAESEYAVIYSIISVACSYTGTAKALILENGQRRSTLAGYIKTDERLLKLPNEYVNSIS